MLSDIDNLTGKSSNGDTTDNNTQGSNGFPDLSNLDGLEGLASLSINSDSNLGGASLSDLASAHLSQEANSLSQLFGSSQASSQLFSQVGFGGHGPSLASLAGSNAVGPPPPLFGKSPATIELDHSPKKTPKSSIAEIDLTSALRLEPVGQSRKVLNSKRVDKIRVQEQSILKGVDLLCMQELNLAQQIKCCGQSSLSKVLCRRWNRRRRILRSYEQVLPPTNSSNVKVFDFSTPSPDDMIREAQYKVFGRQK